MRHADSGLPRTCLACAFLLILFAAVKGAATAPEARKPQPVAPSFQKASVGPVLLGKYGAKRLRRFFGILRSSALTACSAADVPTSLAVSTTLKGKTNLAVSITKVSCLSVDV